MSKILIIEDELNLRETLNDVLEVNGYQVVLANDGRDGVEIAIDQSPDLIICDINMPLLDGYQVLKILTHAFSVEQMPSFIFLTANSSQENLRKGMMLGADDYLTKPFSTQELLEVVEIRLSKRQNLASAILSIERERISSELHNSLQQLLVAAKINLDSIGVGSNSMSENELKKYKNSIKILDKAITETRTISHEIISKKLSNDGIESFLFDLKDTMVSTEILKMSIECDLSFRFSENKELMICNVIQELINNSLKHANCTTVKIDIRTMNDALLLMRYSDDGIGYKNEGFKSGFGLKQIVKKVERFEGLISFNSSKGASCFIAVPVSKRERK